VLQILILIGPMHAVNYFNASVFWAIGRPELRLRLLLVHTAVNVGAFLVVVRYGIVAVAAAYVIRAYALAPIDLVVLRRVIGLRIGAYLRSVAPALVATAIMSAAVGATRSAVVGSASLAVDVSASVLVGAITYTAALWATAPRVVREIVGHVRVAVGRKRSAVAS
jgi:PST family polysaccharide transporter